MAAVRGSGAVTVPSGVFVPNQPLFTFQSSAINAADGASWTTAALGIGAANTQRYVVAAVATNAASGANQAQGVPNTVTIGGVPAELLASATGVGDGTPNGLSFWGAVVPTGTAAVVIITCGSTRRRWGIGLYTSPCGKLDVVGSGSMTIASGVATMTVNVVLPTGAIGLVMTFVGDATSGVYPITYTNAAKAYDAQIENSGNHSGAIVLVEGTVTGVSGADGGCDMLWVALK
jgi:hypothetical protein